VGAVGLTQFMPATAAWMGTLQPDLAGPAPLNPTWAIRALVVYNHWLHQRLPAANACEQLAFALSAYNGGLGWALKRRARSPEPALCLGKSCNINPGITPANQAENQAYPQRILRRLEPVYAASGRWGMGACS
jgi:soluble lytic murein transglycosylase-like protein